MKYRIFGVDVVVTIKTTPTRPPAFIWRSHTHTHTLSNSPAKTHQIRRDRFIRVARLRWRRCGRIVGDGWVAVLCTHSNTHIQTSTRRKCDDEVVDNNNNNDNTTHAHDCITQPPPPPKLIASRSRARLRGSEPDERCEVKAAGSSARARGGLGGGWPWLFVRQQSGPLC